MAELNMLEMGKQTPANRLAGSARISAVDAAGKRRTLETQIADTLAQTGQTYAQLIEAMKVEQASERRAHNAEVARLRAAVHEQTAALKAEAAGLAKAKHETELKLAVEAHARTQAQEQLAKSTESLRELQARVESTSVERAAAWAAHEEAKNRAIQAEQQAQAAREAETAARFEARTHKADLERERQIRIKPTEPAPSKKGEKAEVKERTPMRFRVTQRDGAGDIAEIMMVPQ